MSVVAGGRRVDAAIAYLIAYRSDNDERCTNITVSADAAAAAPAAAAAAATAASQLLNSKDEMQSKRSTWNRRRRNRKHSLFPEWLFINKCYYKDNHAGSRC